MKPKQRTHSLAQAGLVFVLAVTTTSGSWAGSKYKVLHNFTHGGDGGYPQGSLTVDRKGNLYGAAGGGGGTGCSGNGCGVVFELTQRANGNWHEVALYNFTAHNDGYGPNGGLVMDSRGDLYGTAPGGAQGKAIAYQLRPGPKHWTLTPLYDGGAGPGLTLDKAGNLYGGIGPGKHGDGAISELIHGSKGWKLKTLYSFCSQKQCADGDGLGAPLTWDMAGNLYGTTFFGEMARQNAPVRWAAGSPSR